MFVPTTAEMLSNCSSFVPNRGMRPVTQGAPRQKKSQMFTKQNGLSSTALVHEPHLSTLRLDKVPSTEDQFELASVRVAPRDKMEKKAPTCISSPARNSEWAEKNEGKLLLQDVREYCKNQ
jgi:hypothetical protein